MASGTKTAEQMGYPEAEPPPSYEEALRTADTCTNRRPSHLAADQSSKQLEDRWEDDESDDEPLDDRDDASQTIDRRTQATSSSFACDWTARTFQTFQSHAERRQERHMDRQRRRKQKKAAWEAIAEQRLADATAARVGMKARIEQRMAEKDARRAEWKARHGFR